MRAAQSCAGHESVAEEWRGYAVRLLDQLEPMAERLRDQPAQETKYDSCADCPVCAVLAVLNGGRPELAGRLADQVIELLTVLRCALEEGAGEPPRPSALRPVRAGRAPRVQHISVVRDGRAAAAGPC